MPRCMAAADLVISRCGAMTLSELPAAGKASILIPSPNVAENHQYHNAMALVNRGAAICIEEKALTADALWDSMEAVAGIRTCCVPWRSMPERPRFSTHPTASTPLFRRCSAAEPSPSLRFFRLFPPSRGKKRHHAPIFSVCIEWLVAYPHTPYQKQRGCGSWRFPGFAAAQVPPARERVMDGHGEIDRGRTT